MDVNVYNMTNKKKKRNLKYVYMLLVEHVLKICCESLFECRPILKYVYMLLVKHV